MAAIETRRFDQPDQTLDFGKYGQIAIVQMPDGTTGMHAVFEPGWTWEAHEKPLLGNPDSCPMRHIGYCISGELVVVMPGTGEERRIKPGDFFDIPPGHTGFVPGSERCEMALFAPPASS